jgi:hypothetical protein
MPAARIASPPILTTGANSALTDIKLQGTSGRANRAEIEEKSGTEP